MKNFSSQRSFHDPLDPDEFNDLGFKNFSPETMKKVRWVKKMFTEWRNYRNSISRGEIIFLDFDNIPTITEENVIYAVTRFITEIKKLDGTDFPPKTLYDIVICIQFLLDTIGFSWKLLNETVFNRIRYTLDNMMKRRTADGIGNSVRKAQVITFTDEDLLWSLGILGVHSPQVLLDTVLFVLGMSCALRAGKEHRQLRSIPFNSQFEFLHDEEGKLYFRYREDLGLKTNKGGLKNRKNQGKVVDVYPLKSIERCPVRILLLYMNKLPKNRTCNALYLQPRKKFSPKSWFLNKPVGVNTLQSVVKNMCEKGGLPGYYTNHSLRASAATRMYCNEIEEQVIQEITGHRSLAVRSYKRTCDLQRKSASNSIFNKFK